MSEDIVERLDKWRQFDGSFASVSRDAIREITRLRAVLAAINAIDARVVDVAFRQVEMNNG